MCYFHPGRIREDEAILTHMFLTVFFQPPTVPSLHGFHGDQVQVIGWARHAHEGKLQESGLDRPST